MFRKFWGMFMTTNKLPESKKYVVTKLGTDEHPYKEEPLCSYDTLQECADYILDNNLFWFNCMAGNEIVNTEFGDLIAKLKKLKKRNKLLNADF